MLKRYVSRTQLRIVVDGRDFVFNPTSSGSDYVTASEKDQEMLERHVEYGRQFMLDVTLQAQQHRIEAEAEAKRKAIEQKKALLDEEKLRRMQEKSHENIDRSEELKESAADNPWTEVDISPSGVTVVDVQSVTDARNYLFTKFGISKARMLKKNDLLNRAAECSVQFKGKDF